MTGASGPVGSPDDRGAGSTNSLKVDRARTSSRFSDESVLDVRARQTVGRQAGQRHVRPRVRRGRCQTRTRRPGTRPSPSGSLDLERLHRRHRDRDDRPGVRPSWRCTLIDPIVAEPLRPGRQRGGVSSTSTRRGFLWPPDRASQFPPASSDQTWTLLPSSSRAPTSRAPRNMIPDLSEDNKIVARSAGRPTPSEEVPTPSLRPVQAQRDPRRVSFRALASTTAVPGASGSRPLFRHWRPAGPDQFVFSAARNLTPERDHAACSQIFPETSATAKKGPQRARTASPRAQRSPSDPALTEAHRGLAGPDRAHLSGGAADPRARTTRVLNRACRRPSSTRLEPGSLLGRPPHPLPRPPAREGTRPPPGPSPPGCPAGRDSPPATGVPRPAPGGQTAVPGRPPLGGGRATARSRNGRFQVSVRSAPARVSRCGRPRFADIDKWKRPTSCRRLRPRTRRCGTRRWLVARGDGRPRAASPAGTADLRLRGRAGPPTSRRRPGTGRKRAAPAGGAKTARRDGSASRLSR